MSLEDSPTLGNDFQWEDNPELEESGPPKGQRTARIVIAALVIIGLILGGINFLQSDTGAQLAGKGSISGFAVNEADLPVAVEVFVVGHSIEVQSDDDGNFSLDGIPAGEQIIVIGYQGMGHEFPVSIIPGEDVSLGQVRVIETELPDEINVTP